MVLESLEVLLIAKIYTGFTREAIKSAAYSYATATLYHDVMAFTCNMVCAVQPYIMQRRIFWFSPIDDYRKYKYLI